MLIFAEDLKAKAKARAQEVCQKHKNEVLGVNPLSEKFCTFVPKEYVTPPVHVLCSNFTKIGKCVKRCLVLVTKKSENAGFWRHFAHVGRRKPKVYRERST